MPNKGKRSVFQKRHYEAIVGAVVALYHLENENYELSGFDVEVTLRDMFVKDNPNFDVYEFNAAIDEEVDRGPS